MANKKTDSQSQKEVIFGSADLKKIHPYEIFNYLGERYEVKLETVYKRDEAGNPIPQEHRSPRGIYYDGWLTDEPEPKLFKVHEENVDSKETIAQFQRPLTTRITHEGPLDPNQVFDVMNRPLTYESDKLRNKERLRVTEKGIVQEKVEQSGVA